MNEVTTINRTQPEYSAAVKKALARKPQLYINGEWVDSSGSATIDVEDPSSGKVISSFVEATDKDIDRAVAAARTAFDDRRWRDLPPITREKIMHKIADLIDAHADELAELEAIDVGKPKGMRTRSTCPAPPRTSATWPAGPARSAAKRRRPIRCRAGRCSPTR